MDLRHLPTFLTVARLGTVGQAALRLDLAPSSVSEQLRSLEGALGATLFDRLPTGMRLTAAGTRLQELAPALLDHVDHVRDTVNGVSSQLRIGALETLAATHVPSILERLNSRHPDVTASVRVMPRNELLQSVADGSLDAALMLDRGDTIGLLGFQPVPPGLSFADLADVPMTLVGPPDHPLIGSSAVSIDEVLQHHLLVTEKHCSYRLLADRVTLGRGERTEVGSLTVARAWVANGIGLAILPEFSVADDVDRGNLVVLPLEPGPPTLSLRLVWRSDREDDPQFRTVLYSVR